MINKDKLVELAINLARIRSTRDKGEGEIGLYLADYLEGLGFSVNIQEVVPDRFNVIARIPGREEFLSLMLNGHLDMPDPVPGWKRNPFDPVIEGDLIYGAGLTDMKGGLAALISAAEAAKRELEGQPHGDIVLTAVVHHDTIGLGTKFFLAANDRRIDAGINAEPTSLKIQLAHGGAIQFKIVLKGSTAHNSRQEEAINALDRAIEISNALKRNLLNGLASDPDMPFLPRLVIGHIEGGVAPSTTAAESVVEGDVRYPIGTSIEKVEEALLSLIKSEHSKFSSISPSLRPRVYTPRAQRPFVADPDWPIVRALAESHRKETNAAVVMTKGLPAGAYITDAADMVRNGIPTVIYGPGDWRLVPDESISIGELVTAANVYARTILNYVTKLRP
jgi:succinyl-diaminopimelate desuccinylase